MIDFYLKEIVENHIRLMSYVNRKFTDEIILNAITEKSKEGLREEYQRYKDFYEQQLELEEAEKINKKLGFKLINMEEEN